MREQKQGNVNSLEFQKIKFSIFSVFGRHGPSLCAVRLHLNTYWHRRTKRNTKYDMMNGRPKFILFFFFFFIVCFHFISFSFIRHCLVRFSSYLFFAARIVRLTLPMQNLSAMYFRHINLNLITTEVETKKKTRDGFNLMCSKLEIYSRNE